ncbi:ATP-binding protein [Lewinella sp. JB7]|uniref:ATP-binding protein n=1 Tax=Lewinella sp. JB7 TaxID=2962887 RepID=UPI0020C96833|nr:ATP-binding protein [Lewinella sp. JB7]MCP9236019.1 ATP-binding protein [Lewinella sp. JB7]
MNKDLPSVDGLHRAIFRASTKPYLLLRPDEPRFTIVEANPAFARATLSSGRTIAGLGVFEAFPDNPNDPTADGVEKWAASLRHVLEHRQPHQMTVQKYDVPRPESKGGGFEEKYWQPMNIPIFGDDGSVQYILHEVEEVTEQIKAESDRNRFFDIATDVLVKVNFNGYFTEINPASKAILGWTPEEMTARPWIDFVHRDDLPATLDALDRALSGNIRLHVENRYQCKDGSYRWLSWHTQTVMAEQVIYCTASDITQQRRLWSVAAGQKEALEMSVKGEPLNAVLDRLVLTMEEHAGMGIRTSIMVMSPEGDRLRVGAAPSIPEAYNRLIDGMPIGPGMGSCGMAAWSGKPYVASDVLTDPNWVHGREAARAHGIRACWSTPFFSSAGETLGTFALYSDRVLSPSPGMQQLIDLISRTAATVTERERNIIAKRQAEEQLVQARNEAEAANRAKSEFLANMSHEIRTPMNVVVGIANIMARHENLTEPQAELVRTLQNSADSLLDLINDLLDLSKIEAQNIEFEPVPFSITQFLQEITDMMNVRAQQKGLRFLASGACDQHHVMIGDPTRLRQVIMNLCSNALKFTDTGTVSIHLSCESSQMPDVAEIKISVQDTGIGIDAEKLQTIFNNFTQADSSINRKFGGTGLGLSITKRLVELMDGEISVESTPGEGSTFTVTIPLPIDRQTRIEELSGPTGKAGLPPADESKKILLVEDFEPNALIAARYLKIFGYRYEIARNGIEAVSKARSDNYVAILMDVQMPELDGLQATRRIRANEQASGRGHTPIIAMTAYALAGDRERCLAAGMDAYIPKPINADELREKLDNLVLA